MNDFTIKRRFGVALGAVGVSIPLLFLVAASPPQQDEWEWEADEGYHREEWYDPSDWFNEDDQISYENDEYDYDYYDDYGYDGYGYNDYGYDNDEYGWHYDWNPVTDEWDYEYGWHDGYYDSSTYDPYGPYRTFDHDYGWRYVWNPVSNEWDYEYGWRGPSSRYGSDYGRYYEWNPRTNDWEAAYGWHDQQYVYSSISDAQSRREPDQAQRDRQRRDQHQAERNRRESQSSAKATFSGQIDGFSRIHLKGEKDQHTLVRLRMQNGESRIVDLGPRVGPSQLDLESGDRVTLQGRRGQISGRNVLMASSIRVDGDRMELRSTQQPERNARDSRQKATLEGQLDGFKRMKDLKGGHEDHLYVRLRLRDGSRRVVDMGPTVGMSELDLSRGDRVMVGGRNAKVNGRQVLVAERLRVSGDRVPLERQREQSSNSDR